MSAPVLNNLVMKSAKRQVAASALIATLSGFAFYYLYADRHYKKWMNFLDTYDPYERMRELCAYGPGLMESCPEDLAKAFAEKKKR